MRVTCPAHIILIDLIFFVMFGDEYNNEDPHCAPSSILLLHYPILDTNILLRTLFSNTLSLCSSLDMRDQVSHPYKTTGRIMVLYILTFTSLDSRWDDKGL
jgi:hypothetical protein